MSLSIEVQKLRESCTRVGMQMRQMVADAGEKGFTAEQESTFDKMNEEYERLKRSAEKAEKVAGIEEYRSEMTDQEARANYDHNPKNNANKPSEEDLELARRAWFMGPNAPERFRRAADKCGVRLDTDRSDQWHVPLLPVAPRSIQELRDMDMERLVTRATTTAQTITTTGGGHTIQNEAMREIEVALLMAGGVRQSGAEIYRTATGATLPIPTVNDTTNVSVILSINTAADVEALVFGQKTLTAYMFSTGIILTPYQLMQDTTVPLAALIGRAFGERAVKGTNAYFTTGTGSGQPQGVVTASEAGTTSSDVNALTYANLVDQEHSIDPSYRSDPSCGWMMHDGTLKVIKKLTDGQSRPLWLPAMSGLAGGFADRLLGYPITINQNMATIASATTGTGAAKVIVFGAFNRMKIRDIADLQIMRLVERYAEKLQVGWLGHHRHDSGAVVATTDVPPLKYLITKAT
jgi:HK97 family phage major capsid protein